MRFLLLLILLLNFALFSFGQGFFGIAPSEMGREYRQYQERNQKQIQLGSPSSTFL